MFSNTYHRQFITLIFVVFLCGVSAFAQPTGRPGAVALGDPVSVADWDPVGRDGMYANPATGERFNNPFAATMSIINSQNQQFFQAEMMRMATTGMIGRELIKKGYASTSIPATDYKSKDALRAKVLQ